MRATILTVWLLKKTNTEKNCTFSVQNIYDFVNLQIQIKLNLQLKIIFSRTFTNNQKNNNKSIYFENRKTTTQ